MPPNPLNYIQQFKEHLEAIDAYTKLMSELIPERLDKLNQTIIDVYAGAGPSRPQATQSPGMGPSAGNSANPLSETELDLRRALYNPTTARKRGSPTAFQQDFDEAELGGYTGSASSGASQSWLSRVSTEGAFMLPRLQGAQLTLADKANYLAAAMANRANRGRAQKQTQLTSLMTDAKKADPNWDPETDMTPEMKGLMGQLTNSTEGGGMWARMSNFAGSVGSGYTQGQYIMGSVRSMMQPFTNQSNLGFQTGMAQGAPSGLFGLRMPWDPGFWAGVQQTAARLNMSAPWNDNPVTPGQAQTIMGNLFSQGWTDINSSQVQNMRTGAQELMRQNPAIGSMPETYAMMDQSVRQGAASIQHFNDIMLGVPDSMKAAHVSMQQMMSDMDALGQMNKQMGGTYPAGLENAQTWANVTGLPANIMGTLMQNPMVIGQTFMKTGLMPWEQGLASPGQHIQGILGALNVLSGSINTPGNISTQIGGSGFFNKTSGQDQKEALMAHLMGIDKQTVHTMLSNRQGWLAGQQISDESRAYARDVRNAIHSNDPATAAHVLYGQGGGTWGQLRTDLQSAVDSEGKHIFNKHDLNWVWDVPKTKSKEAGGHWIWRSPPHTVKGQGHGSLRHEYVGGHKVEVGLDQAQIANERMKRIQSVIAKDTARHGATGSQSGPRLTIELGPAAKKVLSLQDPTKQYKAGQGAGSATINLNPNAGGPTPSPSPNFDTAGSSGSDAQYSSDY